MKQRTLFARLPLKGQGTGQVQCLRSYLQHVAHAHHLKPRRALELLTNQSPGLSMASLVSVMSGRDNIHTGDYGCTALRSALESATHAVLQHSTLEQVALAFSMKRTRGSGGVRYCPLCVTDDAAQGELPYGRLLWELDFVKACPLHRVRLRSGRTCGAAADEHLAVQNRPSMDGVCYRCGSIAFLCVTDPPEAAAPAETLIARSAERVLELQAQPEFTFSEERLRQGINDLVDSVYGGSVVRAALASGLSRSTVCMWLKGMRPSLPYCIQLCLRSGADISALCRGTYVRDAAIFSVGESLHINATYSRSNVSTDSLRQLLIVAAALAEPPSLRAFARANGLHIDAPRHRAPKEAAMLSAARSAYCTAKRQQTRESYVQRYTAAALELRAENHAVHRRALEQRSGVSAIGTGVRSSALQEVLEKFAGRPTGDVPSALARSSLLARAPAEKVLDAPALCERPAKTKVKSARAMRLTA